MNTRHITRFTYKFTNFQGWRVAITRQGVALARYFSDKQYGDAETALSHASNFRDMVLAELAQHPEHTQEILQKHRPQTSKIYPAGLKPSTSAENSESSGVGCSMRSNKVLHGILKNMCNQLRLDTASVLKLSLYLFSLQYGAPPAMAEERQNTSKLYAVRQTSEPDLQQLITELESKGRLVGLPCFEEFATGRCSANNTYCTEPTIAPLQIFP